MVKYTGKQYNNHDLWRTKIYKFDKPGGNLIDKKIFLYNDTAAAVANYDPGDISSISDCSGNLLLYTDGYNQFNRKLDTISGKGIYSNVGWLGNYTYLKKPGSDSLFYYFHNSIYNGNNVTLNTTLINAYSRSGKGKILSNPVKILDSTVDQIVVKKGDNKGYWLLCSRRCNEIWAYSIDSNGISSTPVVNKNVTNNGWWWFGNTACIPTSWWNSNLHNPWTYRDLLASNNGNKIVVSGVQGYFSTKGNIMIYDFDKNAGKLSNEKIILPFSDLAPGYGAYDVCFSGNDSLLYYSTGPNENLYNSTNYLNATYSLFQYNLYTKVRKLISRSNRTAQSYYLMKLGPDNKIYAYDGFYYYGGYDTVGSGYTYIIENPNKTGKTCNLHKSNFGVVFWNWGYQADRSALINIKTNLEFNDCVDSVLFSVQGDSAFNKLICRFGDGDTFLIKKPTNKLYSFKHYYKGEAKYTVIWEGRTAQCNAPVWYVDTIDMKYAAKRKNTTFNLQKTPLCNAFKVSFTDSVVHANNYIVRWGDDSTSNIYGKALNSPLNLVHLYKKQGIFDIKIIVSNQYGCENIYTYPIQVKFNPHPVLGLRYDTEVCATAKFTLRNDSSLATDTLKAKYNNQTQTAIGKNTLKYVSKLKSDSISIKINNTYNCELDTWVKIKVNPTSNASFTLDKLNYCVGDKINANCPDTADLQFWDWEKTIYPFQNLSSKVNNSGNQNLSHISTYNTGCSDTVNKIVLVNPLPKAAFSIIKTPVCQNQNVTLITDSLIGGDKVSWYTGNKLLGTISSPTKNFSFKGMDTGSFPIWAIAKSALGCVDTFKNQYSVYEWTVANFSLSDSTICAGDKVTAHFTGKGSTGVWSFNNQSSNSISDWFIDSNMTKLAKGIYPVKLLINTKGCPDSLTINISIESKPAAAFTYGLPCTDVPLSFSNASSGSITQIAWNIDGNAYTGNAPKHTFNKPGKYNASLKVSTAFGCTDSITQTITVHENPAPKISFSGNDYQQGPQFWYSFDGKPDTFILYQWKLGTQGNYSGAHQRIFFNKPEDTQHIELTVKNNAGCEGKADTIVVVRGLTLYLFPNSFTPNGDGKNEYFGIAGPEYVKTYKLWIFNRWGEQVFYTENPYELWKPEKPYPGMYVYKAKVQDIYSRWKELHGTVLLIR